MNTGGYDGKGVQVIKSENDYANFWTNPSVVEDLVDIDKELSVIIAKNENGEIKTFPVTEMVADPKLNLLDFNICPANISSETENQIKTITEQFINNVKGAGLFAIELFLDKKGKIWFIFILFYPDIFIFCDVRYIFKELLAIFRDNPMFFNEIKQVSPSRNMN